MKLSKLLMVLVSATFLTALPACGDGSAEDAGKAIDDAVDDIGDAIEDATD